MLTQSKIEYVDLWEAWIDLQTASNNGVGTLYLIGDVICDDRFVQPYFIKKQHPTPHILALEIIPCSSSVDGYIREVMYSEELNRIDQYTAVHIYVKNELIIRIQELETIY